MRIGTAEPFARRRRATSKPEPSGSPTSRMTASSSASLASSRPSAAVVAVDDVAVLGQEAREEPDQARVVLHEEEVHGRSPSRRTGA